jgi:hypothetical protein
VKGSKTAKRALERRSKKNSRIYQAKSLDKIRPSHISGYPTRRALSAKPLDTGKVGTNLPDAVQGTPPMWSLNAGPTLKKIRPTP